MKLKRFKIPTFEEWVRNNNSAEIVLGAYRIEIRAFCWGNDYTRYQFAMALSNCNVLNVYTHRLFSKTFEYNGDEERLKQWYTNTVAEFHVFWENHIKSTYFENEELN